MTVTTFTKEHYIYIQTTKIPSPIFSAILRYGIRGCKTIPLPDDYHTLPIKNRIKQVQISIRNHEYQVRIDGEPPTPFGYARTYFLVLDECSIEIDKSGRFTGLQRKRIELPRYEVRVK